MTAGVPYDYDKYDDPTGPRDPVITPTEPYTIAQRLGELEDRVSDLEAEVFGDDEGEGEE